MKKFKTIKGVDVFVDENNNCGVGKKIAKDKFICVPLVRMTEQCHYTSFTSDMFRYFMPDNWDFAIQDLNDLIFNNK